MNIFNIIIYLKYVGQTKSVDNASKEVNTKSNNGKSLQQKGDYNCLGRADGGVWEKRYALIAYFPLLLAEQLVFL